MSPVSPSLVEMNEWPTIHFTLSPHAVVCTISGLSHGAARLRSQMGLVHSPLTSLSCVLQAEVSRLNLFSGTCTGIESGDGWFTSKSECIILCSWNYSQVKKQLLTLPWLRHFSWGWNDLFCHCLYSLFFFFNNSLFYFIWPSWVLVEAWGIFSCSMWDLVPCPGIKPRPPALWAQS